MQANLFNRSVFVGAVFILFLNGCSHNINEQVKEVKQYTSKSYEYNNKKQIKHNVKKYNKIENNIVNTVIIKDQSNLNKKQEDSKKYVMLKKKQEDSEKYENGYYYGYKLGYNDGYNEPQLNRKGEVADKNYKNGYKNGYNYGYTVGYRNNHISARNIKYY